MNNFNSNWMFNPPNLFGRRRNFQRNYCQNTAQPKSDCVSEEEEAVSSDTCNNSGYFGKCKEKVCEEADGKSGSPCCEEEQGGFGPPCCEEEQRESVLPCGRGKNRLSPHPPGANQHSGPTRN